MPSIQVTVPAAGKTVQAPGVSFYANTQIYVKTPGDATTLTVTCLPEKGNPGSDTFFSPDNNAITVQAGAAKSMLNAPTSYIKLSRDGSTDMEIILTFWNRID